MATNSLLTEKQRQLKYLGKLPANFDYPLFNARRALESQRSSGYQNTAAAAREIVDNSIEAGAGKIHIVFDAEREEGKRAVRAIHDRRHVVNLSSSVFGFGRVRVGGPLHHSAAVQSLAGKVGLCMA